MTFQAFSDYLVSKQQCAPEWIDEELWPRIRQLVFYTIDASRSKLNPNKRRGCFELLGYDFMLDDDMRVWLIEVNSNPCLELCCPHLARELPLLISDTMQVALDHVLPPPQEQDCSDRCVQALRNIRSRPHAFDKIFDPPPYTGRKDT